MWNYFPRKHSCYFYIRLPKCLLKRFRLARGRISTLSGRRIGSKTNIRWFFFNYFFWSFFGYPITITSPQTIIGSISISGLVSLTYIISRKKGKLIVFSGTITSSQSKKWEYGRKQKHIRYPTIFFARTFLLSCTIYYQGDASLNQAARNCIINNEVK